jgi:hypothetical protein
MTNLADERRRDERYPAELLRIMEAIGKDLHSVPEGIVSGWVVRQSSDLVAASE